MTVNHDLKVLMQHMLNIRLFLQPFMNQGFMKRSQTLNIPFHNFLIFFDIMAVYAKNDGQSINLTYEK